MKLVDITEAKDTREGGSYVGVNFTDETKDKIKKLAIATKVADRVPDEDLHTTVIYSRKHIGKFTPKGTIDPPYVGIPTSFDIWDTRDGLRALVLEYDCKALKDRHKQIMKDYDATYDFPEYKTHFTISYDCGKDFSLDSIKDLKIKDFLDEIQINHEYYEDLNLKWKPGKEENAD